LYIFKNKLSSKKERSIFIILYFKLTTKLLHYSTVHRYCTLRNTQRELYYKWVFYALMTYLPSDTSQKSTGL